MPMSPKRPCRHPGCPNLCLNGFCDIHKPRRNDREYEKRRGSAHSRGYTKAWQKASKAFLRKNPLCVLCRKAGYVTPAELVDHIVPHNGNQELFWDVNNWQSLCWKCHSSKTAREDGGFGNRKIER